VETGLIRRPSLYGDTFVGLYVDKEVRAALDLLAKRHGRSRSEETRRAIASHLLREGDNVSLDARRAR
jgi:predicted transcriptional regulator